MSNSQFVSASFADGLKAPHYVNGRLLAAEDLRLEQEATLTRLGLAGKAAGHGVVEGLMVSAPPGAAASVQVMPGLGLNREGQPVRLPSAITLPLAPRAEPGIARDDAGRFKNCTFETVDGGTTVPGGAYLLTAAPASRLEGLSPLKAAAGSTAPPGCAARWEVEGLQFKAIRLTAFKHGDSGVTDANRRNLLAHWCYGSANLPALARDPFHFDPRYSGLDQIAAADLTPCDLPLAVFHWTGSALTFVDSWPARRRLVRPDALEHWQGLLSDKRPAESQARFLQFQEQIDILARGVTGGVSVASHFPFLPPVGFLPITPASLLERLGAISGQGPVKTRPWWSGRLLPFFNLTTREGALGEQPHATGFKGSTRAQSGFTAAELASTGMSPGFAATAMSSRTAMFRNAAITADPRVTEVGNVVAALDEKLAGLEEMIAALQRRGEGEQPPPPGPSQSKIKRQQRRARIRQARIDMVRAGLSAPREVSRGFDLRTFFGTLPYRIGIVDRETVDFTLQRSWYDEALDMRRNPPPRVEVYVVADNLASRDQLYVMFAKALTPIFWLPLGEGSD